MSENYPQNYGSIPPAPESTTIPNGGVSNSEKLSEAADKLRGQAEHAWETTRDQAETALHSGEDFVRENPFPVVIGALALGFVLGLAIVPHKEPETWKERYVDAPLDRSQGALLGALIALAAAGRRLFSSASDCTRETADDVRSRAKPLAKAAKRAGKKLHLS